MAKENKKIGSGEKVKGIDPVTIEYTEKAVFHKAGDKAEVHRIQADKLVKKGVAKIVK